jgi:hypothetical protein
MKKLAALLLLFVITLPARAVDDGQVVYTGGTLTALKEGSVGRFDTTNQSVLTYEYSGKKLMMPYAKIVSFEYSREVARHLGVLPAIAVGLVKKRQRRHYFRISYRDENDIVQVAVFEVPKNMPRTLLPILQTRAPQGCKTAPFAVCGQFGAK